MYKRYYTLEMAYGSGKINKKFETYEKAYDFMCKNYVKEVEQGYQPTLYKILLHTESEYNGTKNIMIQPTWS